MVVRQIFAYSLTVAGIMLVVWGTIQRNYEKFVPNVSFGDSVGRGFLGTFLIFVGVGFLGGAIWLQWRSSRRT